VGVEDLGCCCAGGNGFGGSGDGVCRVGGLGGGGVGGVCLGGCHACVVKWVRFVVKMLFRT
jgi:hypothetical protein